MKPAWMSPDFRYQPSSAAAIEAREKCIPGPDYVPYKIAALNATIDSLRRQLHSKNEEASKCPCSSSPSSS